MFVVDLVGFFLNPMLVARVPFVVLVGKNASRPLVLDFLLTSASSIWYIEHGHCLRIICPDQPVNHILGFQLPVHATRSDRRQHRPLGWRLVHREGQKTRGRKPTPHNDSGTWERGVCSHIHF